MNVADAMAAGNIPALIPMLAMYTGDEKWLRRAVRARRARRGSTTTTTAGCRRRSRPRSAPRRRRRSRAATCACRAPTHEQLVRMLSVAMGEEVPPEYGPMIAAELGLGAPPPAPEAVPEGFRAIVIGAGVSGLATSIKLAEAGIPHVVLERNATVGGTWLENHYPGAGVDTPSALYSFSFAPRDWTMYFALRDELHAYLEQLADDFGVRERIRFDTEVTSARPTTRTRRSGSSTTPPARRCARTS